MMPEGDMSGMMPGMDQGFRVTPGEALTDSHVSGSKDMRLYGMVQREVSANAMTTLTMDGAQLDVALDAGKGFFAACEDGVLVLTPEAEGETWTISGLALKILGRSGIESIRLMLADECMEISTGWSLQGSEYARLCAEGYVSKDYTFTITRAETLVEAAGRTYRINENNELVGG